MNLETRSDFYVDEIIYAMDQEEKKEMMALLCEEFEVDNPLEKQNKLGMILPEEIDFRNCLEIGRAHV